MHFFFSENIILFTMWMTSSLQRQKSPLFTWYTGRELFRHPSYTCPNLWKAIAECILSCLSESVTIHWWMLLKPLTVWLLTLVRLCFFFFFIQLFPTLKFILRSLSVYLCTCTASVLSRDLFFPLCTVRLRVAVGVGCAVLWNALSFPEHGGRSDHPRERSTSCQQWHLSSAGLFASSASRFSLHPSLSLSLQEWGSWKRKVQLTVW